MPFLVAILDLKQKLSSYYFLTKVASDRAMSVSKFIYMARLKLPHFHLDSLPIRADWAFPEGFKETGAKMLHLCTL